jgi:hypothetical protein
MINAVLNVLVWVVVIAVVVAIVVSKLREKPLEWPDLADFGEQQEIWLEGMEDLDVFPQYGYHRYRDVYLNMRRLPIVILEPKIMEGQLAYHFVYVKTGEEGYDLPSAVMLLGQETPARITSF